MMPCESAMGVCTFMFEWKRQFLRDATPTTILRREKSPAEHDTEQLLDHIIRVRNPAGRPKSIKRFIARYGFLLEEH